MEELDMKRPGKLQNASRRTFFRNILFIGGGAAVLSLSQKSAGKMSETAAAAPDKGKGYHVTPHIKKYYETAGF